VRCADRLSAVHRYWFRARILRDPTARRGRESSALANFTDSTTGLRPRSQHLRLYGVHRFKSWRSSWRHALNVIPVGKASPRSFILLPFYHPDRALDFPWKWMFDPTFSVIQLLLYHLGVITAGSTGWAIRPRYDLDHIITSGAGCRSSPSACSPVCRPSVPNSARRRHRWRQAVAAVLVHHLAAVAARDHGVVLSPYSDLADFQIVYVMTAADRPRNPPVRHLRLSIAIGTGL